VLGEPEPVEGESFWWNRAKWPSALHHLLDGLGIEDDDDDDDRSETEHDDGEEAEDEGDKDSEDDEHDNEANGKYTVGRGHVFRRSISGRAFGDPEVAREVYLPLVDQALQEARGGKALQTPGYFCLKRGPFVTAHATQSELTLPGTYVNVFEPELPVVTDVVLEPGSSGVYRDVTDVISGKSRRGKPPAVLHATHRLMEQESKRRELRAVIRGPAETPAVVRIFAAGRNVADATARDNAGNELVVDWQQDEDETVLARFPNDPAGATLEVRWK
jgi:hypothetical protein